MSEARQTKGRNHHIDAFTIWMAGGGIKPGNIVGTTDEFGFGAIDRDCHVHDLHATVLHLLGLDHKLVDVPISGTRLSPYRRRPRQRHRGSSLA